MDNEWKCQCTGCKHSRGEVSDEVYQKYLEDSIKDDEKKLKTEKDKEQRWGLQCNIHEANELLIEFLKSKEDKDETNSKKKAVDVAWNLAGKLGCETPKFYQGTI